MNKCDLNKIYIVEEYNQKVTTKIALKWLIDNPMRECLVKDSMDSENIGFLRYNDERGSFQNRGSHWSEEEYPGEPYNEYFLHQKAIID